MRIAIVKLSAMGDIIHAMVALQFIKKDRPDIIIDWIVEESFADILRHNPDIDNIFTINLKSLKKSILNIFQEIKKLTFFANNNYDLVIDAQGLVKSALVSFFLGKKRVGFDRHSIREPIASWFYTKTVSIGYEQNAILRNLKVICEPLDIKVSDDAIHNKNPFLFFVDCKANCNMTKQTTILLVLGASKPNKIYPKELFLELTTKIDGQFIVIWGNNFEKECAEYLQSKNQNIIVADKMSLDELKCLIANVDLVIGGDTGPTHMAWGLNIPSITLFGNTPHTRNTFVTKLNQVIKSSSKVNPIKLDKNDFSIQEISPDTIVALAKQLLNIIHSHPQKRMQEALKIEKHIDYTCQKCYNLRKE